MKKQILINLLMLVLCQFLVSCATTIMPAPGSDKVNVVKKVNGKCKKIALINTNEVKEETFESESNLHNMNITLLKNKAAALGANTVVLAKHVTTQEMRSFRMGKIGSRNIQVNTHTMLGAAYYCPRTAQ